LPVPMNLVGHMFYTWSRLLIESGYFRGRHKIHDDRLALRPETCHAGTNSLNWNLRSGNGWFRSVRIGW
jgi:hypothetical protein